MEAYILKSTVFLGIFLGAYYLLLSREKMYWFNRFYLLSGLVFSLVLPFAVIPFYVEAEVQPVQALPIETMQMVAPMPVSAPVTEPINYWVYATVGVYGLIATMLAVRFVLNIIRFYSVKKCNTLSGYNGATLVLMNEEVLPHTFMNTIFINKNEYERRLIEPELLTHELAHVRQKHTLDVLFVELLKTVFWFNPLLYLYKKAMQTNHEFLADDAVISRHFNIPTYQLLLLDKATPPLAYTLASSINFSTTKKRFTMMTKTTTKTRRALLQALMLPIVVLATTLLCHEVIAQEPKVAKKSKSKTTASQMSDRDEYYSGVRVIVEDKANNVSIDKKYEQLTDAEKDKYLFDTPRRSTKSSPTAAQYKKMKDAKTSAVWIDSKHVDNKILNNYKPEDFSLFTGSFVHKNARSKAFPQKYQYGLYTDAYYEKHFTKYHYPADVYRVNIAKEYKDDKIVDEKDAVVVSNFIRKDDFKWPPSDKIKAIDVYKNTEAQNDSLKKARPDLFKVPGTKYGRIHITYEDENGELKKTNLFVNENEHKGQIATSVKVGSYSQTNTVNSVEQVTVYNTSDLDPQPEFPGGLEEFFRLIKNEMKIPETKEDKTLRVYVSFVIETDGRMSNFKVLRDPGMGMGDEAIRALKTITTKWSPGKLQGKEVRASYSLPITVNVKV
nr:M56 family metallopeptidase [uncultured Flavobacterium sp.]